MISLKMWPGFNPKFEVVSCLVEIRNGRGPEILLLERAPDKPEGGTLDLPAGKVDADETLGQAIRRELWQETGIKEAITSFACGYQGLFHVRHLDNDFRYHTFRLICDQKPEVTLNPKEHSQFLWVPVRETLDLPLIPDLDECIKYYFGLD